MKRRRLRKSIFVVARRLLRSLFAMAVIIRFNSVLLIRIADLAGLSKTV
jgi:hypothetical protein